METDIQSIMEEIEKKLSKNDDKREMFTRVC